MEHSGAPAFAPAFGMASTHDLGRRFEEMAERYLVARGWQVLERNVRRGRKEIDLVVRRGRVVAFVEVKGRRGAGYGHPLEAITWRKRREIAHVARGWIGENGLPGLLYRFDAVAVECTRDGTHRVQHVEDAWRLD